MENPIQKSLGAINIGTSVMALKYKDGVMIAADTSTTYGSMMKIKDARRIIKLTDDCIFAASGEMSDFQDLTKQLRKMADDDEIAQDGASFMKPRDYFNFIGTQNYQRRLKMNPLWCTTIVAGVSKEDGEVFLGSSDLYGTKIEQDFLLSGLAMHYCQVLMQNRRRDDMSEDEARALMLDCMKVMFYRDKKSHDQIQISVVTKQGVTMYDPIHCPSEWGTEFQRTHTNELYRPLRILD